MAGRGSGRYRDTGRGRHGAERGGAGHPRARRFSVERIQEIEAEVRHDVIAFTTAVAEIVGPHARWFHYGLTSNDVVDTAQALLIKQASALIAHDLDATGGSTRAPRLGI